jgi:hypothetical protein
VLAPGAIVQAMLQGAGLVGCCRKVLIGRFILGVQFLDPRSWVLCLLLTGRFDPGSSFLEQSAAAQNSASQFTEQHQSNVNRIQTHDLCAKQLSNFFVIKATLGHNYSAMNVSISCQKGIDGYYEQDLLACFLNHVAHFALGINTKSIINLFVLLHFCFFEPQYS